MFTGWPLTLPIPALKHRHPYHHHPFHLQKAWLSEGLPRWHGGKELTCQCRRHGIDPWVRRVPWRRKWQPTSVFLLEKSHGQRRRAGYSPWGHKESDTTERLTHTHTHKHTRTSEFFSTLYLIASFQYIKTEITAVTGDLSDQCHLSERDSDLAPPRVGTLGVRMPLYV